MKKLLSTRDAAEYLGVNEKMIYTLVAEKGLPASKVTGKWVFPLHLVDAWVEANTLRRQDPRYGKAYGYQHRNHVGPDALRDKKEHSYRKNGENYNNFQRKIAHASNYNSRDPDNPNRL